MRFNSCHVDTWTGVLFTSKPHKTHISNMVWRYKLLSHLAISFQADDNNYIKTLVMTNSMDNDPGNINRLYTTGGWQYK